MSGELGKSGLTRRESVGDEVADAETPDAGPLRHLIPALWDVGPYGFQFGMAGAVAEVLPFREIMAWPGVRNLLPCEIQTLRDMSRAAASGHNSQSNVEP